MKKKVGLFGGTFNPIHFGHLNLALELKEKKELDEVWFVPACCSPFKASEPITSSEERLKMVKLALEELPSFKVSTLELEREAPSYTIDTAKLCIQKYPDCSFSLLLGEDSLVRFTEWKNYRELVSLIPLWIGSRPSSLLKKLSDLGFDEKTVSAIQKGVVSTRQMEISASEIRERLKNSLYCGHLVPSKVLDYIYRHQLYFNSLIT